jgi:predicted polyphosphate/ATP-dependent NAD kinase
MCQTRLDAAATIWRSLSACRDRLGCEPILNASPPPATGAPRVGLIVNPHAGRDVRRLVAPAGSLTNHERVNLVRRLLVGLQAAGVHEILYMPDRYGIVARAAADVAGILASPALAEPSDTPDDTLRATEAMVAAGVGVLVTHGGDGTNRLVALRAADVPLLPLAAGTNNAFPLPIEATAAGFAAGFLSRRSREHAMREGCLEQHKRICVSTNSRHEVALVDAAITRDMTIGSRAVWDPRRILAFMVTRAAAGSVGLSSLAGALVTIQATEPRGAFVEVGQGITVAALVAPGMVAAAEIRSVREIAVGSVVSVGPTTGSLTLDGERSIQVRHDVVRFALDAHGPWVVNPHATLQWAQRSGAFRLG